MGQFELSRRHILLSTAAFAAASSVQAKKKTTTDLAKLAEDAAIWGFPLVQTGRYLELAKRSGSTLNQFYLNPNLATPALKVAGPNVDTIYGYAWLDLTQEPIVLDVPDAADRYYSIQLIDAYENSFAYVGRRETGTKAGTYVIAGPGWTGAAPTGAKVIKAPTNLVFTLTRTLVRSVTDAPAAQDLQEHFTLSPLSAYPSGKKSGVVIENALNVLPLLNLSDIGPTYFDELNALVKAYPPTGPEAANFARFSALGLGTGAAKKRLPAAELEAAYNRDFKRINTSGVFSQEVNGWRTNYHISKFIKDPLARAAANLYGPGGHISEEALYFSARTDRSGAPLSGADKYEITFPAGQLPPVDAFWSLILYDKNFWLVDNPINRYTINDRTPDLKFDASGALKILIQHKTPVDRANWLPAPEGNFQLILRAYQPKPEILQGKYPIPSVQKI